MRMKQIKIYHYDELNEQAKKKAREWYREGHLDYDWWDFLYDDFALLAQELGIDLRRTPVKLMNGKTRYEPEIYFNGFHHQESGSSFSGTWRAWEMNPEKLKKECPTDIELHQIAKILTNCVKEDQGLWADIRANRHSNAIHIEVYEGVAIEERLNSLEYLSVEYNRLTQACQHRADEVREVLQHFNQWIYKCLKTEYEYLTSDDQIEATIRANEYEFTEDGSIA